MYTPLQSAAYGIEPAHSMPRGAWDDDNGLESVPMEQTGANAYSEARRASVLKEVHDEQVVYQKIFRSDSRSIKKDMENEVKGKYYGIKCTRHWCHVFGCLLAVASLTYAIYRFSVDDENISMDVDCIVVSGFLILWVAYSYYAWGVDNAVRDALVPHEKKYEELNTQHGANLNIFINGVGRLELLENEIGTKQEELGKIQKDFEKALHELNATTARNLTLATQHERMLETNVQLQKLNVKMAENLNQLHNETEDQRVPGHNRTWSDFSESTPVYADCFLDYSSQNAFITPHLGHAGGEPFGGYYVCLE